MAKADDQRQRGQSSSSITLPTLPFKNAKQFRTWLHRNHAKAPGIWIRFFKKNSGKPSVTYPEAVEEALCFGWIDSLVKKFDDESYIQKFTPRRSKSLWSKINCEKALRLIEEKRMQPAGLAEIERAKSDGRWDAAYDSPATSTIPDDFHAALNAHPAAHAFYKTLNRTNTYAILWRLQTAKMPETRARRIEQMIAMLTRGEKLHP